MNIWGIDLGGTKIEGVILDTLDNYRPIWRNRIATESQFGYDHVLSRIKQLIDQMKSETGLVPKAIGLGTPGVLDPITQTMKNCNTVCLNGQFLKRDLEAILPYDLVLANDANCFALAESVMGAGQGADNVFGVIMGTGVGGGIVINERLVNGHQGIAGEWGHNPVVIPEDLPCYCGKNGCIETVISGPALERYYADLSKDKLGLREIVNRHKLGSDPHATATINRLILYFGKALATIINILDPAVIILGGGVGNIDLLLTEGRVSLERFVFNNRLDTQLVKPLLGDSAGVFGAAMLTRDLV